MSMSIEKLKERIIAEFIAAPKGRDRKELVTELVERIDALIVERIQQAFVKHGVKRNVY